MLLFSGAFLHASVNPKPTACAYAIFADQVVKIGDGGLRTGSGGGGAGYMSTQLFLPMLSETRSDEKRR